MTESVLEDRDQRRVVDQIDTWRKQLINLVRSNRLLYFRHTRTSTIEIPCPPDELSKVADRLLARGSWRFYEPPESQTDDQAGASDVGDRGPSKDELVTSKASARDLGNALRALDRRATQEFMDKGIWILYLAVGMLHWADPDTAEQAESPLVMIPVQLFRESPREPYELRRADEDVVVNPAISVKLAEFGVELPSIDEDELDVVRSLAAFDLAVASQPGWEVRRRLVIGSFSFHKEVMYRDLLKNEGAVSEHPLVQALAVGAKDASGLDFEVITEDRLDTEAPAESIVTILDADATQLQCITAAAAGRSFVMDGPPGTGKSQTIANVIAELIAKGKTVLFVSEKAAALEVVHKRLRAAGLADYCLELHSHKATRKEVARQLGRALEHHPVVPPAMAATALAQLARRRAQLSARSNAMNEIRQPLALSLHHVIGRVSQLQVLPQAPPPTALGSWLSAADLTQILVTASEIARCWGPVERGDDFVWRDLASTVLDSTRSQRTLEQIDTALTHLAAVQRVSDDAAGALLLQAPGDFETSESLARVLKHLESRPAGVPANWISRQSLEEIETLLQGRRQLAMAHMRAEKTLVELVGPRWRDVYPEASAQLNAALGRLGSLSMKFVPADVLPASQLRTMAQFLDASTGVIASVKADSETIATGFGLPLSGITLDRAGQLAELASLVGQMAKPEPQWINPAIVAAVDHAAKTLQPLCAAFNQRREQLGRVFTEAVLELDLESLWQRFQTVHTGFGKLKGQYRADKKTVAAVARSAKASKNVVALLPQALEWQRLTQDLRAAESQHSGLLGPHYYRSTESDFEAISHSLESARRALEIAGRHLNVEAMQRQLGRGGAPSAELLPTAARLKASIEAWNESASEYLGPFADSLSTSELGAASEWCAYATGPVSSLADAGAAVAEVADSPITFGELRQSLDARGLVATVEQTLADDLESDRRQLGEGYRGLETTWDALQSSVNWAAQMRTLLGGPASTSAAERLTSIRLDWSELDTTLDRWHQSREIVVASFFDSRAAEVRSDLNTTFADVVDLLNHLARTIGDIDEWVEYQSARERLNELKMGEVIGFCESTRVGAGDVPGVVERACLERWADVVIEEDRTRLEHLRADQLDPMLREFRELDAELIERAGGRAVAACNERRPRTTIGAAGVIKREAEKQRRHMPVQKLLEETGEVAQALKPCFMMSPLTVSQFVPPSLHFDAVIFDEASQVRPSDAINCIYRGSQLIVAGDDKQLPPTSFFEAVSVDGDDEWEEDQFEEFESILKLGKGSAGLRELPLKWHYRSQHEDLIAYSNYSFYDGRLVTFPGAASEAGDLGVKFFPVADGIYRRGTARDNPKEAEIVVDRVLHWARYSLENPTKAVTLGVVAFSEAQANAIEVALDRRRRDLAELDPFFAEDRLDGFFVKNLENVQGDERDVMVFSVGYGRDENGRLTMNFGPLNREGGERRLNVAITRARRRVELVASITGTEPEFATSLREGPRHLQRYLDYAARGPMTLAIELGENDLDAESPFEEEVIRTIRSWGYKVQPQVGTAGYRVDIGVWHPGISGRFALGVECDGRMYHSSAVARDRDRLRQEVLERLGWRIYRIWGTSWYRYRSEQEERLKAAIAAAIDDTTDGPAVSRPTIKTVGRLEEQAFEEVALDTSRSWTVPYRVASPRGPRPWVDMHLPEAQYDLQRMMLEVIEIEGPIEDELLLRRVREAWGVGRAGHRIRVAFQDALRRLSRTQAVSRLEGSYTYSHASQLEAVRVPGADPLSQRPVAQISRTEAKLAVRHLIAEARRVSRDELTFEVCRCFGWNRRGSDIAAALDGAVDALVREGLIVEDAEFLKATEKPL
jgi:very-short-patch-repair endonuclease